MSAMMIGLMLSIFIGFLCVAIAFPAFVQWDRKRLALVLGLIAAVCWTLIPVTIGVFYATTHQ